ncbi:MAG: branched-chain amino acid transport system II carrier protein, partial [Cetobacterium sp.]|nr:branched-chain amino acid transport system II carrier protein [Cetobacterium sp.]
IDALASILFGVVIVKGIESKGITNSKEQKVFLIGSGVIAAIGLGLIYFSLIYLGSQISGMEKLSTAQVALTLAEMTLGKGGKLAFGLCVGAACLTTSVGLTTLVSDWFSKLLNVSYRKVAIMTCIFSGVLAVVGLDSIIALAIPVLIILYPITIVLILLNIFDIKNENCYKLVTLITLVVSIAEVLKLNVSFIPLANSGFPWIVPAILAFGMGQIIKNKK